VLEAADARGVREVVPEEDGSVWPEPLEPGTDQAGFHVMGVATLKPYIEGYTDKKSYLPGETIHFHVSTNAATYSIEIIKEQWQRKSMGKVTGLQGAYYPIPPEQQKPWENGAGWPVGYSWVVPPQWENGNYLALFRTTSGDYAYAYHPFIVRTQVPGSVSKVVLVLNYNTRQAYNFWGGKSLYYSGSSTDPHYAVAVSFLRPFWDSYGRGKAYWGSRELTSQLIADGFNPEYLTEYDIDSNPAILRAYDVVVFSGHHEYISRNLYDALEAHHHRGGHLAFFSANDIYWQVRFEDNGNKMVGYKSYSLREDPMVGVDDSLVTVLWRDPPVNRPPEALHGIYYIPYSYCFKDEDYIVQDADNFAFAGTGLKNGDVVGYKVAAAETDSIGPASPAKMDILMSARRDQVLTGYEKYVQVDHVDAVAVYYEDSPAYCFPNGRGGQVFAAGTNSGWGIALEASSAGYEVMRKITRNIIQHMVDAPPPSPTFKDIAMLASHWLDKCNSPNWCDDTDLDMSGIVNVIDFAHFSAYWSAN
jgi:hypothetical protein